MTTSNNTLPAATFISGVVIIAVASFFALVLIFHLISDGLYSLAGGIAAIMIFLALVFFRRGFSPYRWLSVGLVFAGMFTIYPIISTVIISTTNMSGGHLITKQQAIDRLESKTFLAEDAPVFSWTAYRRGGDYLVLFKDSHGDFYLGRDGQMIAPVDSLERYGSTADEPPQSIDGHQRLTAADVVPVIELLGQKRFLTDEGEVRINSLREASVLSQLYRYDARRDVVVDTSTGTEYVPVGGTFTSEEGETLIPGFKVSIGLQNYARFLGNPGYREPILRIVLWNLAFSFFSVAISFALGLMIALLFEKLPGRRLIRTLLIIPYPIPVLVSITVWKGLLNESMGLVTNVLENLFGSAPSFFTDRHWARIALVLINVYLSYPYFYILASGALRSISQDIYEAAEIDGASELRKLHFITMPLILRILMPLLIASFSFNFNNFTLIWGFNAGLPAMADSIVPMGHTDLLISFVYRLGFSTANASNYGFAAAITVLLFLFVTVMVAAELKSTGALKEDL